MSLEEFIVGKITSSYVAFGVFLARTQSPKSSTEGIRTPHIKSLIKVVL
jgi:hypothetical protein